MKFFRKVPVAVTVMVLSIVAALCIGQARKPVTPGFIELDISSTGGQYALTEMNTVGYEKWIDDKAGILSDRIEEAICLYNANWDSRYHSLVAVVTIDGVSGDLADFAYEYGLSMGLGEGDAILVMDVFRQDAYLATGTDFSTMLTDSMATEYMDTYLYAPFMAGDYDEGTIALYSALHMLYVDSFGMGGSSINTGYEEHNGVYVEKGFGTMAILFFVLLIIVLAVLFDGHRYDRYRSGYYGPTYVYRPFIFGRPRAPRPPHHGGPRPGGMGGSPRPGADPRPGGMHSSRSGFGSSSRSGGGFSRGGGGSRGGGFGGRR